MRQGVGPIDVVAALGNVRIMDPWSVGEVVAAFVIVLVRIAVAAAIAV